jgi:DNA-directed RNA polymerase subunit RPC12/RpoP
MLDFACIRCSHKLSLPGMYRGKRIVCPKCRGVVLVPGLPGSITDSAAGGGAAHSAEPPTLARAALATAPAEPAGPSREPTWVEYIKASRGTVVLSWIIVLFGLGWLLHELNWLPGLGWLWVLGLAIAGFLVLLLGGINKQTLIVGPFLILTAGFSILRQQHIISLEVEIPCLVIAFGLLLFSVTLCGYQLPDMLNE